MYHGDLTGVHQGFSIETHELDHTGLLFKALHVVQVGEHRIPALDACRPGRHDHMLSGSHELHAGAGDGGLKVLCVVAAGKGDADEPV